MAATPRYRVQVFDFDGSFGIGSMLAEFENAKNVGWANYLNEIPEAFFTLDQDDPKVTLLRGKLGRLHVRIYRDDDLVWTGWAGMEHDSTMRDTVIFCYGYLAGLFFLSSAWKKEYPVSPSTAPVALSTFVEDAWKRANGTDATPPSLSSSPLAFVSTGTIESPVTTSAPLTATSDVTADTFTRTAHGLANGTQVVFTSLGTTTGLTAGTTYYVVSTATNTFKVAATSGGTAINITGSNATVSFNVNVTLPSYTLYYKRLLLVMREMAALGIGNTTNTCVFEITNSTTPTFNFWKNRGTAVTDVRWRYGDGLVADYRDYQMPVYRRNELLGVGSAPSGTPLQTTGIQSTTDISTWGRRQEPIYFAWVRDQTELDRATQLRLALAQRDQVDLTLRFHPNAVLPPGATGAGYKLSDTVPVYIDRGVTNINDSFLVTGVQVVYDGIEKTRLMLRQRNGS